MAVLSPVYGGNSKAMLPELLGLSAAFGYYVQQPSNKDREMTVETASHDRGLHGYFARGNDVARRAREAKAARIAVRADELAARFGGFEALEPIDAGRVRLAARHFVTAEITPNLNQSIRATRAAELLLSRIRQKEAPTPSLQELLAE